MARFLGALLFLLSVGLVTALMPELGSGTKSYELGKAWKYDDLVSPVSFPILKPEEEIAREKERIRRHNPPWFRLDPDVEKSVTADWRKGFQRSYEQFKTEHGFGLFEKRDTQTYLTTGREALHTLYLKGVFDKAEVMQRLQQAPFVYLVQGSHVREVTPEKMITVSSAPEFLLDTLSTVPFLNEEFLVQSLVPYLKANAGFDSVTTGKTLKDALNKISPTFGAVEKGERIVQRGAVIDTATYQKLVSYTHFVEGESQSGHNWVQLGGYLALSLLMFLIFHYFLRLYAPGVLNSPRKLLFILLLIIAPLFLTSWAVRFNLPSYYLIPYCIVPIVLRTFFDSRMALISHLITILLASFIVPLGNEFTVLNILAGMVAIFTNMRAHVWSQFFASLGYILATYLGGYLSIHLLQTGTLVSMAWTDLGWLSLNVFLTLMAYPLIPVFEKLFGIVSDVTLMEYTDINKPLMKRLSLEAPGTFQHSIQVSNLAENVVTALGGNSLLAKVGSLYHDIGKLHRPQYFVENQKGNENPHKDLSFEESAAIIIDHVRQGVILGRREKIPGVLLDFIRTHHGTSRVEYFYRSQLNQSKESNIDESKYRYPGPLPRTLEQAVVMLADTVEAAARSLKEPTAERLDALVEKLFAQKTEDLQLVEADITFAQIMKAKKILKRLLHNVYHVRIEYPE